MVAGAVIRRLRVEPVQPVVPQPVPEPERVLLEAAVERLIREHHATLVALAD